MPGLYLKSCQHMEELADDSIDLIVTSPPYWMPLDDPYLRDAAAQTVRPRTTPSQTTSSRQSNTGQPKTRQGKSRQPSVTPVPTYAEFLGWLETCFTQCYRVLKPGRFCAVVVNTTLVDGEMIPLPFHLVGRLERVGFVFHQDIMWYRWRGWDRRAGTVIQHPYPGYYRPNRVVEYVLVFRKPGGKRLFVGRSPAQREASRIPIDGLFTREIALNLWHMASVQPRSRPHPCPFPEELAYRLITLYSYRGERVLDPFLGSGTTAKVARLTGRDYYGYEINPVFLRAARRRLQETTLERQDWLSRCHHAHSTFSSSP